MTGTGTSTDPYIVDIWADFVSCAKNPVHIKFADGGGVIDMNKEAPNGIDTTIINGAYVDGNGWTITNLYNKKYAFATSGSISNMRFLNVYSEPDFIDRTYLYDCVISGIFGGGVLTSYRNIQINRCSFNIQCFGTASYLFDASDYSNLNYNIFNHCKIKITNDSPYSKIIRGATLNNCTITGNTSQSKYCLSSFKMYNSILDLEAPNMKMTLSDGSGICIANIEKAPNVSVSGNWQGVNTAQMNDAAYLAGLGFPIGVD